MKKKRFYISFVFLSVVLSMVLALSLPTTETVGVSSDNVKSKQITETIDDLAIINTDIFSDRHDSQLILLSQKKEKVDHQTDAYAKKTKSKDLSTSFWIRYINVGQGDSAIVQCDGHYMMIDGGPASASSTVYTILKKAKIDSIDCMIATHPDADHIGGLSGALNYAKVEKCYSSVSSHNTKTFESLLKYLQKQNTPLIVPDGNISFYLGSALVEVIVPAEKCSDTNNNSIVTKITYGNNSFLFMGDAETEEENKLLDARNDLACDVLKAGHHGSSSSTGDRFLGESNPQYVILSVGTDNSYGHPTFETLARLKPLDVTLYRTDLQGDITCESNGEKITFSTSKTTTKEALWEQGSSAKAFANRDGSTALTPEKTSIPEETTYVLNKSSKRFHHPTCKSVGEIAEKNKEYSAKSSEELIANGYKPCGRCKPHEKITDETSSDLENNVTAQEKSAKNDAHVIHYVLNTKTKKFHDCNCSSVADISPGNKREVTWSREKVVEQGYSPCKRCSP
ncbi:MAG: MBL fold metallo-hydrolase [Lachnospiraceae bacterium]|nr:MBL fold metallo-hydrolase [Lachnospiraceae bacterium]